MNLWTKDEIIIHDGEEYLNAEASNRIYEIVKGYGLVQGQSYKVSAISKIIKLIKNNLANLAKDSSGIDKKIYNQLQDDFPSLDFEALSKIVSDELLDLDEEVDLLYNCIHQVYSKRIDKDSLRISLNLGKMLSIYDDNNTNVDDSNTNVGDSDNLTEEDDDLLELKQMLFKSDKTGEQENNDIDIDISVTEDDTSEKYRVLRHRKALTNNEKKTILYSVLAGAGIITFLFMTFVQKHNIVEEITNLISVFKNNFSIKEFLSKLGNLTLYAASVVATFYGTSKFISLDDKDEESLENPEEEQINTEEEQIDSEPVKNI